MYRLIFNDLYKIFHKKSFYLMLVISFLFIMLINILYKNNVVIKENFINIDNLKEEINDFKIKGNNIYEYVDLLVKLDYELFKKEKKIWQINMYNDLIKDNLYNSFIKKYIYGDEIEYEKIKKEINHIKNKINGKDWKYLVQKLIINKKNTLQAIDKNKIKEIEILNSEIKILEYRIKNNISYENDSYSNTLNKIYNNLTCKINYDNKNHDLDDCYQEFKINEYAIKNKIKINKYDSNREVLINFFQEYEIILIIFTILLSISLLGDDYIYHMINHTKTMPYKCSKLFISKIVSLILAIIFVTFFLLVSQIIIGSIFLDFNSIKIPVIGYDLIINRIRVYPIFKYLLLQLCYLFPKILIINLLAFTLSIVFKGNTFGTILSCMLYFLADIINYYANIYHFNWMNYLITLNWDLRYLIFHGTSIYHLSWQFSVNVIIITILIILLISYLFFKKKN